MTKIVVTQDLGLTSKDIDKLKQLGKVTMYDELSKTPEECIKIFLQKTTSFLGLSFSFVYQYIYIHYFLERSYETREVDKDLGNCVGDCTTAALINICE